MKIWTGKRCRDLVSPRSLGLHLSVPPSIALLSAVSAVSVVQTPSSVRGDGFALGAEHAGGVADRREGLGVAGAAAEVAGDGEPDLGVAGVRVAVEQRLGRHDHAGDAEA